MLILLSMIGICFCFLPLSYILYENTIAMSDFDLVEVDSLEALVIVDNDLDPLSPIAPDTVQVSGLLGHLASNSPHKLNDRGDACKELRMEDVCCSAHGLSILVVSAPCLYYLY